MTRQSATTQSNPACAAHSSTVSPRARPAPRLRPLGNTATKARKPALSGRARLVWLPDFSSEQPIAEPTTLPSRSATNVAQLGSSMSSAHSPATSCTDGTVPAENVGARR